MPTPTHRAALARVTGALAVGVAVAAALYPLVGTHADVASCSVTPSSYADAIVNPPAGEDTEFFVNSGGIPSVLLLVDTSSTMLRLGGPNGHDGASLGWGSFEAPANNAAGMGYGCSNGYGNTRVFHSSCGTTTWEALPYDDTKDFASARDASGNYCSYMVSGNQPPATNQPGYDPDFYSASSSTTLFNRTKVYHDTLAVPLSSTLDGWSTMSGSPAADTDATAFCARATWSATQQSSCASCMASQGYWFDGSYLAWTGPSCATTADCQGWGAGTCIKDATQVEWNANNDNSAHCRVPNVWLKGNFLNFDPPKHVVARKVLKDVLATVRKMRLGMVTLNGDNGGALVEPLNPACNQMGSPSSFDANRTSIKNGINSSLLFSDPHAPLAEALLDSGQLYLQRNLPWFSGAKSAFQEGGGQNQASVCFSCQATAIVMISDAAPTADGVIPGTSFAPTGMTKSVADTAGSYAGMAGYNITGISSADCPVCNTAAEAADTSIADGACFGQQQSGACGMNAAGIANSPIPSYLPKVAWYLHNMDFRADNANGADGFKMIGKQSVTTYTIGVGTSGNQALLLQHTAQAGGGMYNGGSGTDVTDAGSLRQAILQVLQDVQTRSTSFGAASLSTLQASASQGVLVPRFEPSRSAHWNGHLYAFDLYSEFTGDSPACYIPASGSSGPANGDYDCDGRCTSVFLKDADGDFIQEDGTGAFKKNNPRNRAACGSGNRCAPSDCGTPSNLEAVPRWDAGAKLSPVTITTDASGIQTTTDKTSGYTPWNARYVYTVTDSNGDGKFTAADTVIRVVPADVAATLAPYLNIQGTTFCENLSARLTAVGNPDGATIDSQYATGTYTKCAEVVLQYVLGADVFNERGCAGFPTTLCTRPYQLGDIFHSSPVEVWPPLTSDGYLCKRGLHSQCLASLFSGSIPNPSASGNANAYDDYAKTTVYRHRKKFALVGANDGMLHAFITGVWRLADDPRTTPDESKAPYDGFHDDRPSVVPSIGDEMWAFIPPDLLPKLRLLLDSTHQFYVDGTPMVRDVWLDGGVNGTANRVGGTPAANGIREGNEFFTVAVVGERRGGTHYFALDVTDATDDLDRAPRFLWLYPQPNDPEELAFGETYVEFVPKPPPIGPVRIDAGAPAASNPPCPNNGRTFTTAAGASRCFEEHWIAFLSGGFDPQYTKGRGVHMVDIKTGDELWDFSQPPGPASLCTSASDPRCHLNYPVAASVGMMMWGKQANFLSSAALDGYFDTATFGDTGGQLWVLRFSDPGVRDATQGNKVNNWYGARIFQHAKDSSQDCGLNYCAGQPFFYITSNLPLQANGLYRVLAGTGDRFNLLDPIGGVCGPDNLRACVMKGCTVKLEDASGGPGAVYGVPALLGTQGYHMDQAASCTTVATDKYTYAVAAGTGPTCSAATTRIDGLVISCPSTQTCSGVAETTTKRMSVTCNASGSCDATGTNDPGHFIDLKGNLDRKNWFFSVQVFEGSTPRAIFSDQAGAIAYDAARLSETSKTDGVNFDLADINAYDAAPATSSLASPDSRGWKYYFDHGDPDATQTTTIGGNTYHIYRTDERSASVSAVEASCTFWNTMQTGIPPGAYNLTTDCPVNSPCKAARAQISYLYGASPSTGGLCMQIDGSPTRVQKNETLVPPHIGKLVAYVSSGQVSFGLTSVRIPQGGSNIALGEVQDIQSLVEWIPVDKSSHDCRHVAKDQPAPPCR